MSASYCDFIISLCLGLTLAVALTRTQAQSMHDPYGKYPDVVGSSDIAYKAFRIYACVPYVILVFRTLKRMSLTRVIPQEADLYQTDTCSGFFHEQRPRSQAIRYLTMAMRDPVVLIDFDCQYSAHISDFKFQISLLHRLLACAHH